MSSEKIDPTKKDATISFADNTETETKIAKDELNEERLAKASGGFQITKTVDSASPKIFEGSASPPPKSP
jgi:hypothetical protein